MQDRGGEPESSTANRIYRFISENPGCHLRQIRKELRLGMGTVQYHLYKFERAGRITSTRRSFHRYYFPAGMLDNEKDILQVLNQETAGEILLFIIENGSPTNKDISTKFRITSSSVNWHMRRLIDLELIAEQKQSRFKRYQLRGEWPNCSFTKELLSIDLGPMER